MSGSLTDPAVFDPTTGTFVTAAQAAANAQQRDPSNYFPPSPSTAAVLPAPPPPPPPPSQTQQAPLVGPDDMGPFGGQLPGAPAPTMPSKQDTANLGAGIARAYDTSPPPAALPGSGPDMGAQMGPQAPPPPAPPPQMSPAAASQGASGLQGYSPAPTLAGHGPEPLQSAPQAPVAAPTAPTDAPSDGISGNSRNNPLNLRFAGQDGATNVGGFAAFPTQAAGIAAAQNQFKINAGRGINTLTGLISSWAPPNENDTAAYIKNVSNATGISPDAKIDITDPSIQAKIIPAMSLMENGPVKNGSGQAPANLSLNASAAPPPPPPAAPPPASLPGVGSSGLLDPNNMDLSRFQSSSGDKLMALGAGLMSGPTLGLGLSKGLTSMNSMGASDRAEGLKTYQALVAAHTADARMNQMAQTYGLKSRQQDNNDLKTGTGIDAQKAKLVQGDQRLAIQKENADALNSGARVGAAAGQKDNEKSVGVIDAQGPAAVGTLRTMSNFQSALANGASPGSDMISQYKRELATRMGVDIGDTDPSSVQLANSLGKQLQAVGAQGMKGTGLRTEKEFKVFIGQVAGLDQNPDTVRTLIQPIVDGANHDLQVYQKWHSMGPDAQGQILNQRGGVSNWLAPQNLAYAETQGITPGEANTTPTAVKTKDGWTSTTSGVKFKEVK